MKMRQIHLENYDAITITGAILVEKITMNDLAD